MTTPSLSGSGALTAAASIATNTAVPDLLNSDDYDTFSSLDIDYFVSAAGERVREYCNWHIYPTITTTAYCPLMGDGTILLPTRYLTGVIQVVPPFPGAAPVDPNSYYFDETGTINFIPMTYGFAPTPASVQLWPIDTFRLFDAYRKHRQRMIVTFTHGYPTIPFPVAEVGYELLMRTLEKPAGVAQQVTAGPYSYQFAEFGMVLTEDQKNRLSQFKLPAVA